MKAILEFDPITEKEEFNDARCGGRYRYILSTIDEELRNKIKYTELNKEEELAYRLVRQRINDLLLEENLDI